MAITTAAAILGAAVIGGGAAIFGASSAKKAAKTQSQAAVQSANVQAQATQQASTEISDAARIGSATQLAMYGQTRADLAPWRETGARALEQLEGMYLRGEGMDKFKQTPGYQFRLSEGIRALDRSASARGKLHSGGYGRALVGYGQGVASDEFGTWANRLTSLAGVGQTAATTTGQLGQQAAATAGQFGAQDAANAGNVLMAGAAGQGSALQAAGTARASGYVGAANAITGGIQNVGSLLPAVAGYGAGQGWWGGLDPNTGIN